MYRVDRKRVRTGPYLRFSFRRCPSPIPSLDDPPSETPKEFVDLLEGKRVQAEVVAKVGYDFEEGLVNPKVLASECCEVALLLVGPKTFIHIPVVNRISSGIVPTAVFVAKEKLLRTLPPMLTLAMRSTAWDKPPTRSGSMSRAAMWRATVSTSNICVA